MIPWLEFYKPWKGIIMIGWMKKYIDKKKCNCHYNFTLSYCYPPSHNTILDVGGKANLVITFIQYTKQIFFVNWFFIYWSSKGLWNRCYLGPLHFGNISIRGPLLGFIEEEDVNVQKYWILVRLHCLFIFSFRECPLLRSLFALCK